MRGHYFVLLPLALLVLLGASLAHLTGRVYDGATKEGIPDLIVKLIPPKATDTPEFTTVTDSSGKFSFNEAHAGKYLLEVFYGITVIHREVIALDGELDKSIAVQRTAVAPLSPPIREVSVRADRRWTDTEIVVGKGEVISFVATGEIRWGSGADQAAGPDGDRRKLSARVGSVLVYPVKGMGAGGLIARVGKGTPFRIGAAARTTMPGSGELYLGINDNYFSSNSGVFHVAITRSSP